MKHKVHKMLIIMVLTLAVVFPLGSYGLFSWSLSLDGNAGFYLFYSPLSYLHEQTERWGFNRFVENGRHRFARWKNMDFPVQPSLTEDSIPGEPEKEDIPEPAPLPEPDLPLYDGDTLDILVIGDSLANSVGKRLEPMINEYADMTCSVEGVISSNLIRLDYYDWLREGPRLTEENAPDCVLIFLGANTMQSFYLDGTHAPLFSEAWLEIYRERAASLLAGLKDLGVDIFWMDLPPMQKESYNNNIRYLNEVIDQVCQKEGVDRFSYRTLLTDEQDLYVSEKIVEDRQILIRSDGVHFTLEGASYVSGYLIENLRDRYEMVDPVVQEETLFGESLSSQEIPL